MNQKINYIIDILLTISFILIFITGILKLPWLALHRFIQMRLITLVHDITGIIFLFLILCHIILHFKWFISMTKNIFEK